MPRCDLILPCRDEGPALVALLPRVSDDFRVIVVDNGSSDDTAAVAARLGALVVSESVPGYGSAIHAGLMAATHDFVAFMDGDGSFDPADLLRVAGPVLDGSSDLVLGARHPTHRGAWPVHARLANRALVTEIRRRTGVRLRDLGPLRAARRDALMALGIEDRRFGWPLEMVLRAAAAGWRIDEIAVPYSPRVGKSKVTGTIKGTIRAVKDMSRVLGTVSTPGN